MKKPYHFGQRLREVRLAKRLTQVQLGERAGIPQSRIAALEQSQAVYTDTVQRLALALGVKPGELL